MVQIGTLGEGSSRLMRRHNKTTWLDSDHWACHRHLPAQVLPASIERCWLCTNKRPLMKERPKEANSEVLKKFDTGKRKARRPAKPKMIVARRQAVASTDALADVVASPPPPKAPSPAKKAAKAAPKPSAAKKAAPKAAAPLTAGGQQCAWIECSNVARPRSKYCSRNCSNKNARARHKARK